MVGGTRSYEMARRLVQYGHEVHVLTSWREECEHTDWFEEVIDGINVHWIPVKYDNSMNFRRRMKAFIHFALQAGRRALILDGDVVFATSTPLTIALPGAFTSWRLDIPMIFEVRDLWPDVPIAMGYLSNPLAQGAARLLERFAYKRSAHIVALSDGMADGVAKTGYSRDRITVIPNGSDLELFQHSDEGAQRFRRSHPELGEGPIVLYPGALGKVNGVCYLARLASSMLNYRPEVRFVVIGDGSEADHVRDRASALGALGLNYFQYSAIPKRELIDAFSAATVVVSLAIDKPALRANSANKFFDALSSGKPVAINYQGWQQTLLEETGAGIALGPDPESGLPLLLKLLASPLLMAECGRRAREVAVQRFDRDKLAMQLERILVDVVGDPK